MYKPHRGSSGGWKGDKKFGKGNSWAERGPGGRDSSRPSMHKATCSACGEIANVPFKPNGRKPIFCSNCFRKDDQSEPRKREGRERFGHEGVAQPMSTDQLKEQFKTMNTKLDNILRMLTSGDERERSTSKKRSGKDEEIQFD